MILDIESNGYLSLVSYPEKMVRYLDQSPCCDNKSVEISIIHQTNKQTNKQTQTIFLTGYYNEIITIKYISV